MINLKKNFIASIIGGLILVSFNGIYLSGGPWNGIPIPKLTIIISSFFTGFMVVFFQRFLQI